MKTKTVKVSSLKPHKSNPNKHPQNQLQELQNSLDQFDQVKNIVVWQGQVIAGCGLLEAAKAQGRETIEVQDVSDWQEEKAIKFMISDNRLAEMAIMDDDLLSGLLLDFDDPLDIPGIDQDFLDSLDLDGGLGGEGDKDPDEVPAVVKPVVKSGELWLLGRHRVLCSDSTQKESIERLMDKKKAVATITDPPYNYDYAYGKYDDDKTIEEYEAFTTKWYNLARIFSRRIIVTPGLKNIGIYYRLFNPLWMLVWIKKNAMTASKIGNLSVWEPILLEANELDYEPIIFEGRPKKRVVRDVYEFPVKKQKGVGDHPCPKLLDFWAKLITDFTNKDDLILEFFLGSGTSLIACEQTNRICYGIEISEHYCTVILERWAQLTGKDPIREDDTKFSELKNKQHVQSDCRKS